MMSYTVTAVRIYLPDFLYYVHMYYQDHHENQQQSADATNPKNNKFHKLITANVCHSSASPDPCPDRP